MGVIILGSGSFAREVYDWATAANKEVIGFFSGVLAEQKTLRGLPIYYDVNLVPTGSTWIIGTGNPKAMLAMRKLVDGRIPPSTAVIHPSCIIGSNVSIGAGSVVCPGTILTCDITVGESVAINIGCTIGHDTQIGSHVHLSPNTSLSGNTQIGDQCEMGTGSSTNPGVVVPSNTIIGAGTVVNKSLEESGVYVGIPAKKIK
ncbi:NeuD/PglB/VioB family sugar acetyltransferase [Bdellovibrio bacteriovorus]|uniref:NeuD/PglB/VioB family sugar acetyltransferase n=1 Tax=Bdellovibrio bacteriovorus TaxID=959 RepID=UPI0035A6FAD2